MKLSKLTIVATSFALVLAVATMVRANSEEFTLSAEVPAATGASFGVSKVTGGQFADHLSNNLDFGTLVLTDVGGGNQVFLGTHYFAIDIGGAGGVGMPVITVAYQNTGAPIGSTVNLGDRAVFVYSKMTDNGQTETAIDGMSLDQSDGKIINPVEVEGGFLRVNVAPATGQGDEGDAIPFNLGDKVGFYNGTLTITGTPQ